MRTRWNSLAALCAAAMLTTTCSRSSGTEPSGAPPTNATTISIRNNVVSPRAIVVPRGTQITFVNGDTQSHDMNSDPHPEHSECPEINQVGLLTDGQARQTGNLVIVRTCGYHDHQRPDTDGLRGTITIQ